MKGIRSLLLAAILTFVIAVVATFPARVAYHWFAPPQLALQGISGSIWSGAAREVSAGVLYLRELRWRLRPMALLTGQVAVAVSAKPATGFIDLVAAVSPSGAITLTDVNGSVPLSVLQPAFSMPGLAGDASVRFERVAVEQGFPVAVDGEVLVGGLVVPLVDAGSLGGYRADFSTEGNVVTADVQDTDGVVDLVGQLKMSPDTGFEFLGQVAPKPETSGKLRQQMQILGTPNARGQREIRLQYAMASGVDRDEGFQ